jgi:hypothetical protein
LPGVGTGGKRKSRDELAATGRLVPAKSSNVNNGVNNQDWMDFERLCMFTPCVEQIGE